MKKIRDMKISNTVSDNTTSYLGSVLVDSDHSFEGVVYDEDKKNRFFVFGSLFEQDGIEVVRCSKYDMELPRVYRAVRKNNLYDGYSVIKTADLEADSGKSRIYVVNPEKYREIGMTEQSNLEVTIRQLKKGLGEDSTKVYQEMFSTQEKILKK